MKLERPPLDAHEILAFQLLDSDRVDVTPGSNVVGKYDQLCWFAGRLEIRHVTWKL